MKNIISYNRREKREAGIREKRVQCRGRRIILIIVMCQAKGVRQFVCGC